MASNPSEAEASHKPPAETIVEGPQADDSEEKIEETSHYFVIQEEKTGFSVDDLVWGKIRSHPWWPGQIVDPKHASEMALKRQKKDCFLVAYFGDKTFAWVPESNLKHFQSDFSVMEKQSSVVSFLNAVDSVLEEFSRRIGLGLACHCLGDETYASLKNRVVENASVREGTIIAVDVDGSVFANSFQPESLLKYILVLAECPSTGFVRHELEMAKAHLRAFYRSKGYPELPLFSTCEGLVENDAESEISEKGKGDDSNPIAPSGTKSGRKTRGRPRKNIAVSEDAGEQKSPSNEQKEEEDDVDYVANGDRGGRKGRSSNPIASRNTKFGKRTRGRPRKRNVVSEDDSEQSSPYDYMEEEEEDDDTDYDAKGDSSGRKVKSVARASTKKQGVTDSKTATRSSTRTRYKSVKIGDHISRAASHLKGPPMIAKSNDETLQNSVGKRNHRKVADSPSEAEQKIEVAAEEYSSPSEMLLQLCLVAAEPMEEYSSLPMIKGFFTKFRASISANFSADQEPEKSIGRKRGRKKKEVNGGSASAEISEPEYMQDTYWADLILQSSPEREPAVSGGQRRKGVTQKKKAKLAGEPMPYASVNPSVDAEPNPHEKQAVEGGRIISDFGEQAKEETPTTLILSFNESDALPSAAELINIFSPYGPLREKETEILRKTSRAKVVFKYRHDAENAFSSAGKYSVFGPALVSYRLRYAPSPKSSPASSPQNVNDVAPPTSDDNLELQGGTRATIHNK